MMASTASMHKNRKSTMARIKRFLAKDDHFSTTANQIIMKCHNSLYSQIYSVTAPVQCSVHKTESSGQTKRLIHKDEVSSSFVPVKIGDEFGPTWSSHLFKVQFQIPSDWKGKHIHFRWNSSSEAMLIDKAGAVLQGFIPKHRESFTITKNWQSEANNTDTFYVEMACNGLFGALGEGFSIDPPINNLTYKLKMADIAVFEPLIFQLYTDLEILLGIAEELSEDIRGFQALYSANEMINLIISNQHENARKVALKHFSEGNGDKAHTLIALGHCHIDTAWLWTYNETKRKCARSWASQIGLMKEYPTIVFTCSQMQQLAWIKEDYPDLFESIKEYVALKRFIPVGGTWVEMDGLIPDGESFIRQFFYGQRFLQKEFGMKANEFWLPDTFGYSGQIPQILKHVGLNRFLTQKISWNRVNKFPHHSFWWEGIDGSKILAHFPPGDSYEMNGWVKEVLKSVNNSEDKGRTNVGAYLYGLGDGGGGPTVGIVERLHRLQNVDGLPKIIFGGLDYFFEKLEADSHKLCKWAGELYLEMHNGTYTSQAKLKWYNRKLEMLLKTAELKNVLSKLKGHADNMQLIDDCWKGLLLNQFHDVIPGSCIEQVVIDALEIYNSIFTKINCLNMDHAKSLGIEPFEITDSDNEVLVGFNPLPWTTKRVFSVPITDLHSKIVKSGFQHIKLDDFPDSRDHRDKNYPLWTFGNPNNFLACLAELQPSGYSKTKPQLLPAGKLVKFSKSSNGSTGSFSNGIIRLEFSLTGQPKEKLIKLDLNGNSALDWEVFKDFKETGTEPGMFYIYDDNPVCWDAWDCDDYHLETRRSILNSSMPGTIEVVAEGPIMAIYKWKVVGQSNDHGGLPLAITRYTIMKAESPLLEYITIIDWEGQSHKFLKVEFPVNVFSRKATYEIQYGHISRPTHSNTSWEMAQIETSGHKWVDLSQHDRGVSLLNDSKYGFRIKENVIQLSLLRAPKAPDGNCDMHKHVIRYAVLPHNGSFQEAGTVRQAYEFNSHFEFYRLPQSSVSSLPDDFQNYVITTSHESVIPEVLKLAHDNPEGAVCIRLYESFGGSPANVKILLRFKIIKVAECDALENRLQRIQDYPIEKVLIDGNAETFYSFSVDFRPFQIRSFLLLL